MDRTMSEIERVAPLA